MKQNTTEAGVVVGLWTAWWASHSVQDTLQIILLLLSILGSILYAVHMTIQIIQKLRGPKDGTVQPDRIER